MVPFTALALLVQMVLHIHDHYVEYFAQCMRNITARKVFENIPFYTYVISIVFASCYFAFCYFMNGRSLRIIEVLDHNLKRISQ